MAPRTKTGCPSLDFSLTSPETIVVVHGTRVPSSIIPLGSALMVCPSPATLDPPRNSLVPSRLHDTGRAGHLVDGHDPAADGQYRFDIDQSRSQDSGQVGRCSSEDAAGWNGIINRRCAPCHSSRSRVGCNLDNHDHGTADCEDGLQCEIRG